MSELIFVLGGARSGKSSFAAKLAAEAKKVAYLATAKAADDHEMGQRIKKHQRDRLPGWITVEEPLLTAKVLQKLGRKVEVVIVDCLTLFVSNWLFKGEKNIEAMGLNECFKKEALILAKVSELLAAAKMSQARVILVANEVGLGVHPATVLGRCFRDMAGRVNQTVATAADEVYFMVAGIPQRIK